MRDQGLSKSMIRTLWGEFNSLFHEEAKLATQQALKELLRESLQGELEEVVGCKPYERSENRKAHRHGSYPRTLGTTVGQIAATQSPIPSLECRSLQRNRDSIGQ